MGDGGDNGTLLSQINPENCAVFIELDRHSKFYYEPEKLVLSEVPERLRYLTLLVPKLPKDITRFGHLQSLEAWNVNISYLVGLNELLSLDCTPEQSNIGELGRLVSLRSLCLRMLPGPSGFIVGRDLVHRSRNRLQS